jgi:hypothetical protein
MLNVCVGLLSFVFVWEGPSNFLYFKKWYDDGGR